MKTISRIALPLCGIAVLVVFAGCASNRDTDRRADNDRDSRSRDVSYQDDFVRTQTHIETAEQQGAFEFGSAALNSAREKLSAATEASEEGEHVEAQRLLREADLDAELALATARNQQTQSALRELQATIQTLDSELQRRTSELGRAP